MKRSVIVVVDLRFFFEKQHVKNSGFQTASLGANSLKVDLMQCNRKQLLLY